MDVVASRTAHAQRARPRGLSSGAEARLPPYRGPVQLPAGLARLSDRHAPGFAPPAIELPMDRSRDGDWSSSDGTAENGWLRGTSRSTSNATTPSSHATEQEVPP